MQRSATALLSLIAAVTICLLARSALQVTQGLQADYFLETQPAAKPALSTVSSDISAAGMAADWNSALPPVFRARWYGYLTIGEAADYTFATTSDDGSRLFIDGRLIVDNGGLHGSQQATGIIRLERGSHFVLLEYEQAGGPYEIDLSWSRGGREPARVPAWVLSPNRIPHSRALAARALDLGLPVSLLMLGLVVAWLAIQHGRGPAWRAAQARPRLAVLALFAILAVVETWPLASDPAHYSRNDNGDTLLNEWTLAWIVHQAPRAPLRLYDGNIFYPERDTIAYSEAMIVQSTLAAPLVWMGASPVLAYNLVLLAGFTLTGWAFALMLFRWTGDWVAAILTGILAGFNAHTISRLPHMQAQHVEFLPWAVFALDALLREPRSGHALRLAGWFALQSLTSVYLLVLTAFGLAGAAAVRPETWRWARLKYIALAAVCAVVALVPFLIPYWRAYADQGLTRTLDDARWFAASWNDYLTTPGRYHGEWWSYRFASGSSTSLFPGVTALLLTCYAVGSGMALKDPRARMCLAMGAVGVALSFGPKLPGYQVLYQALPLLHAVRAPVRFGYLGIVATAMVAGLTVAALRQRLAPRRAAALVAVSLALAVLEPLRAPLYLPRFEGIPPIYRQLRDVPGAVVAELPFPHPWAIFHNARFMLHSTEHWKPMLNGYSGFVPYSYREHYEQLKGFPDQTAIASLQALNVTHLFVHTDLMSAGIATELDRLPVLTRIAADGPIVLYKLRGVE